MTLFLIAILIAFSAYRFVDVFDRRNPTMSRTTLLRPVEIDSIPFYPTKEGFDLVFGLK